MFLTRESKAFLTSSPGDILLTPTRIYTQEVLEVRGEVLGVAHITGGGIVGNVLRILPQHLSMALDIRRWEVPSVFKWIAKHGQWWLGKKSSYNGEYWKLLKHLMVINFEILQSK